VSDIAAPGERLHWPGVPSALDSGDGAAGRVAGVVRARDARRALQLALAGCWLLDAVLQFQPAMFTRTFSDTIGAAAAGNPAVIARPITWDANLVGHHLVPLNALFAAIQLLLGLGIAFRPTVRPALAASVAWAVAVWWLGEGLGGVLNGTASPLNGAPGAVILYALLAVLLWPADSVATTGRHRVGRAVAPFTAAKAIPAPLARALWLVLWLSLAFFALTPANRAPRAVGGMIAFMASGEPGWLAGLDRGAAALVSGQGLAASAALAAACTAIAAGVYLPGQAAACTLLLAIVVATLIWVFGEALGGILTGGGTDPNSGPLLVLLALAYWPATTRGAQERGRCRGSGRARRGRPSPARPA
jgi:hypothetical protein